MESLEKQLADTQERFANTERELGEAVLEIGSLQSELADTRSELLEMRNKLADLSATAIHGDEKEIHQLVSILSDKHDSSTRFPINCDAKTHWEKIVQSVITPSTGHVTADLKIGDTIDLCLLHVSGCVSFYVANIISGSDVTLVLVSKGVVETSIDKDNAEDLCCEIAEDLDTEKADVDVSFPSSGELGFRSRNEAFPLFRIRPSLCIARENGKAVAYWLQDCIEEDSILDNWNSNLMVDKNGELGCLHVDNKLGVRLVIRISTKKDEQQKTSKE